MKEKLTYDELHHIVKYVIWTISLDIRAYHQTDVLSYNESLESIDDIAYSIYDISQVPKDIIPPIMANPDSFIAKEMICNDSLRIFNCGCQLSPNSDYEEKDFYAHELISFSFQIKPGFYRWIIKQRFNMEIDPKNDADLRHVEKLFLSSILRNYMQSFRALSVYEFGEVFIYVKNIKFK